MYVVSCPASKVSLFEDNEAEAAHGCHTGFPGDGPLTSPSLWFLLLSEFSEQEHKRGLFLAVDLHNKLWHKAKSSARTELDLLPVGSLSTRCPPGSSWLQPVWVGAGSASLLHSVLNAIGSLCGV